MRSLAPRERRLVALGLLVGVVAAVWLLLVAPLVGGFQARAERRETLLAEYQANQRLLASIPSLQRAASQEQATAALYQITAPSTGIAAEALKQRLSATLAGAGGTVAAVQDVQAGVPIGWVSARADARLDLDQFVVAIRQLENEAPYVVVQYISVEADRTAASGHAAPLAVRLQVSALFRPAPAR